MNKFSCIVRILIITIVSVLLFKLGFRLVFSMMRVWYITMPALIIAYYIFINKHRNKNDYPKEECSLDPKREVKLKKGPVVTVQDREQGE